jgi:hypothetical protein
MSNLIEITEAEATALIMIANRENVLPLRFGGNRTWLDLDQATNLFTDHLKKMRNRTVLGARSVALPSTEQRGAE